MAAIRDELGGVSSKAVADHGRAPGITLLLIMRPGVDQALVCLCCAPSFLCMISFHSQRPVRGSVTHLVCRCRYGSAESSADTARDGQPASPGTEPQGLPAALWCWVRALQQFRRGQPSDLAQASDFHRLSSWSWGASWGAMGSIPH